MAGSDLVIFDTTMGARGLIHRNDEKWGEVLFQCFILGVLHRLFGYLEVKVSTAAKLRRMEQAAQKRRYEQV